MAALASLESFIYRCQCYVSFSGCLSRSFSISQGTGQGRILATFMYKVYINSLLNELSEHNFAIFVSSMKGDVRSNHYLNNFHKSGSLRC